MNFKIADLIEQVEKRIAQLETAAEKNHTKQVEQWHADHERWMSRYAEDWAYYANRILTSLEDGKPIRETDHMPPVVRTDARVTAYFNNTLTPPEKKPSSNYVNELKTLLKVLRATDTTDISAEELEKMGFNPAFVFREDEPPTTSLDLDIDQLLAKYRESR